MHKEILTSQQLNIALVKAFKRFLFSRRHRYCLAFRTSRSIDFDLFILDDFNNNKIRARIKRNGFKIDRIVRDEDGQFTLIINKIYFLLSIIFYTKLNTKVKFNNIVLMPDI